MPWSNQTGNGGRKGAGGTGGPWGQGPQNPRPGGGNSPDLEDILRRGQDRLRRAMPGGRGPGGRGAGGGVALAGLVLAGLAVVWLFNAVYTVQPDEVGVEMLLGKPKQELSQPGLHFVMWPFETIDTVPVVENQVTIGSTARNDTSGLMLSRDQNIVDVRFGVLYSVDNPQNYLFNVDDPQALLRQTAESAMREVVGRRPVEDIFRDDRAGIAEAVRGITQDTLNTYGAGLLVRAIAIEEAAPPTEVADAFEEVQRAEQDEDRYVEEANRYQNEQLGQARADSVQIREDAAAYKNRVVQEAEGESARFSSILTEYEKAPDITRRRLYLETMENVLRASNMVLVDDKAGGGVMPYLPLPELQRRTAPAPAGRPASQFERSLPSTSGASTGPVPAPARGSGSESVVSGGTTR